MESISGLTKPIEQTEPTMPKEPIEQKATFKYIDSDGEEKVFETDENGYVDFGDISRTLLGQQSQYVSRYVDGKMEGYPKLGEGLQFKGDSEDYFSMKIHKNNVMEFIKRYKANRHIE